MSKSVYEDSKDNNIYDSSQSNLVNSYNNTIKPSMNFETTIFSKNAKWYAPTK